MARKKTKKPGSYVYQPPVLDRTGAVSMTPEYRSRVKPSFKSIVDVNEIIKNFHKTGQLPPGAPPQFGDGRLLALTLAERIEQARSAHRLFENLPKPLRQAVGSAENLASLSESQLTLLVTQTVQTLSPPKPTSPTPPTPPTSPISKPTPDPK